METNNIYASVNQSSPLSASSPTGQGKGENTQLAELEKLWDEWYDNPTKSTGEALLTFLEQNEGYFEEMAAGKPAPPGFPTGTPFSHYYNTAISYLQNWIDAGCNPNTTTPVSEWIGEIDRWLKEPN